MTLEFPEKDVEFFVINDWVFSSLQHLIKTLLRMLYDTEVRTAVKGSQEQAFLMALFECHPDYHWMTQGRKTTHIEVHCKKGGMRCFHAVFADGMSVYFSFETCIKTRSVRMFVPSNRTDLLRRYASLQSLKL